MRKAWNQDGKEEPADNDWIAYFIDYTGCWVLRLLSQFAGNADTILATSANGRSNSQRKSP